MASLNQDQIAEARRQGGTIASILPARNPGGFISPERAVMMLPESASVSNVMKKNILLGVPENAGSIASMFSSNPGYMEFVVRGSSVQGPIQDLQLVMEFSVANAPVTLVPTYQMFRSIQFYFNSSAVVGDQYATQTEIMADVLTYLEPDTMRKGWCQFHNSVETGGSGPQLPIGSGYQFGLDMKSTIVSAMKYDTGLAGQKELRIRFQPAAPTHTIVAGSANDIVCTRAELWANVDWMPTANYMQRLNSFRGYTLVYPYVSFTTFQAPGTYSITANQPIRFPLNIAPGSIQGMYLYALPVSPTVSDVLSLVNLDNARFTYFSSTNEILMQPQTGRYLKYDAVVHHKGHSLFALDKTINIYPFMFISDCEGVATGKINGSYFDTFNGSVVEVSNPVTVPGNFQFFMIILYNRIATQDGDSGEVKMSNY